MKTITTMKLIYMIFSVILSAGLYAQTDVIANRSHAGDLTDILSENDNFGLPDNMPIMVVDTVIYDGNNCLIEIRSYDKSNPYGADIRQIDTICNNQYFIERGFNLREIKKIYPSSTVFIGFSDTGYEPTNVRRWPQLNGANWLVGLIVLSGIGYIFFPYVRRKAD
jgi:hypothetical protein